MPIFVERCRPAPWALAVFPARLRGAVEAPSSLLARSSLVSPDGAAPLRLSAGPPVAPMVTSSAIARSARAVAGDLLLQERLDLGQRALLGLPGDVGGPGQRDLGHGRGLDGQRAQVLGLEAVHVGLAARPRE